jgi:hypothetical protein
VQNYGSEIKNLGVHIAPNGIIGRNNVGGIAAQVQQSHITNCYITGNVIGNQCVGGIAAWTNMATISQCYSACNVVANDQIAGGITSDIIGGTQIIDCYFTGDMVGNITIGGISGRIQGGSKISRCYTTGNITATNLYIGGIVGSAANLLGQTGTPEISNCFAFNSQLTLPNIATLGRIIGNIATPVNLSGNYAWDEMYINTIVPPPGVYAGPFDPNDKHGENITACMAVVEGKNDPNTVYSGWNFPNIWTFDYTNYNVVTGDDKTNLPILSVFSKTTFPNALQISHLPLNEVDCDEEPEFIPVINIVDVPTAADIGIGLTLAGTVVPANATHQTIVWSVKTDGGTGSTITGEVLTATHAGTVTVMATIAEGAAIGIDYTQDFEIVVNSIGTFTITATATDNGTINPSGNISVDQGANQQFDFTSNLDYIIDQVLIDGANDPAAATNGLYIFTNITTNHTIHVIFIKKVGVTENTTHKVQIFPNPTYNEISIKSEFSIKKVEVYSIEGILLLSENNCKKKISVSNLPKGVYILKVDLDNDTVIHKIVKE